MSTSIDVPTGAATFPQRCVRCAAAADTTVAVECTSGIDLVFFKYFRVHDFPLPCCSICKTRRRWAGVLFHILGLLAVVGVFCGMCHLEPLFTRMGQRDLWLRLILGTTLGSFYLCRNWLTPMLDAALLGVSGVRLTKTGIGTLKFRDRDFATEAESLSKAGHHPDA